jgi:hypothetical protein
MTRRTLILLACLLPPILGLAVWWVMPGRSQAVPAAVQPPVVAATEAPAHWVAVPVVPAPISIVSVHGAGELCDSRHDAPEDDDYADLDLPPVPPDVVGGPDDGGIGIIKAYPDELSQRYAGANGAHRMKEALKIISVEYVTPDKNGDLKPVKFIQESNPGPSVEINSMSPGDVSFDSIYQTASFTISGKITDEIAQITGDGSGDIQTAAVYAEGKKLADVTLNKIQDAVSLLKPYAHHYEFSQQITVDMKNAMYCSVEVVTSENKLHQTGRSAVLLTQEITPVDASSSGGGSSVVYSIALSGVPLPDLVDSMSFVPSGSAQPVNLTESDVASLRFSDPVTGWEVDLLGTISLSDTTVDNLKIKLSNSQYGSVIYGTMQETGISTNLFMLSIPVLDNGGGDDDEKYTATFADIAVQPERSAGGHFAPYLFRLKGPGVEDLKISVDGTLYSLTEKDGYYYFSGSPIKVFILGKGNIWLLDGAVKSGDLVKMFTIDGWPNAHFGKPSDDGTGIVISKVETLNLDPDRAYGGTEQEISLSIAGRKWVDGDTFDMIGQQNTQAVQLSADKATMTGTFQFVEPVVDSHTKASINVVMSGVPSTLHEVFYLNNRADTGVWQGSVPDSILPYIVRREYRLGDILKWKGENFDNQAAMWGHDLTWDELSFLEQVRTRDDVPMWYLISDLTDKEKNHAESIFASKPNLDDRYEAYANYLTRRRIITFVSGMSSIPQIQDIYRLCRDLNPVHFAWERGWQIGGGVEQFTRIRVSRSWAAIEMVAALAIIKATDVGINKLSGSIANEALVYTPRREVLSIKIDPAAAYPKTIETLKITPALLKNNPELVPTGRNPFVRDINGDFYIAPRYPVDFPNLGNGNGGIAHPQILGGGVPVTGAGEIIIQHGKIVLITNKSGHYQPSSVQMMDIVTDMWKQGFAFQCKPGTVGMVGYKVVNGRVIR